jgi:hypothetical protein
MALPEQFLARRAHNARNGNFWSLRVIYATGDGSLEFGRIRMERDGWGAWGEDEDFGRALRAACVRAGRHTELPVLLAEIKCTYNNWYHEEDLKTEAAYETYVASHGDASGAGQDRDANSRD